MVSTWGDPGEAIHYDFQSFSLCLLNNSEEALLSAEHFTSSRAVCDSQRWCVCFLVLVTLVLVILVRVAFQFNVISLEDSHKVERCDALLTVRFEWAFNILEGTSPRKCLILYINLCILMVDLHLVETLISHSLCMNDEAALSVRSVILIFIMV